MRSGPTPITALEYQTFHPYSDFLLHDMGRLGDGIGGDHGDATRDDVVATPRQMRTQSLWGLWVAIRFLHDGRANTMAERPCWPSDHAGRANRLPPCRRTHVALALPRSRRQAALHADLFSTTCPTTS
ncbi:MAG: hypothetical protein EXR75_11580 [Myxococcales bacterium]|nr:hypothetical protein [Myxococcales bacterium]